MNHNNSDLVKQYSRLREADCLPELRRRKMGEKIAARMFEIRENQRRHNPYDQELRETTAIMQGDIAALEQSILEEYSGELGVLNEEDSLRNVKNISIVVITLASRAAIRGGLSPELAFAISDVYINELERCRLPASVSRLCRGAEYHFTRLVQELSAGAGTPGIAERRATYDIPLENHTDERSDSIPDSPEKAKKTLPSAEPSSEGSSPDRMTRENEHVARAKDYIYRNLHQKLGTEEIAEALALNPRYLSTLFHRETGMTISAYIRREKIRLVKNMLTYSEYSYLEIAHYLGFSSQSHLGDVFRRETGMTLKKFRQKYQRKES